MRGLKLRSRRVSVADVTPFHVRPVHLRHSIADEFAQYVWGPDLKLPESSELLPAYQSLVDRRQVASQTGRLRWEFKGLTAGGVESDWQDESKMLETFTPLQLVGWFRGPVAPTCITQTWQWPSPLPPRIPCRAPRPSACSR